MILRNDGTFVLSFIEALGENNRWFKVGGEEFFAKAKDDSRYGEIYMEFSSSGECWQQTGIHATFKRSVGVLALDILSHVSEQKLRLVETTIAQTSKEIMEAEPCL